jgi:hypothetical protein
MKFQDTPLKKSKLWHNSEIVSMSKGLVIYDMDPPTVVELKALTKM